MTAYKEEIPVFFACDDRYIPYLSVSLVSLIQNASEDALYSVHILHSGLDPDHMRAITALSTPNVRVRFVNVHHHLRQVAHKLSLRDYYSLSIYYRLFIPALYPGYDKAVYLDADTVVLSDIKELYRKDLGTRLLAAVPDAVIASDREFIRYAEEGVGVPYRRYFNSGVLLMNLEQMRKEDLEGTFISLLDAYGFNTVCPDQDYLNVICRGRVLYLSSAWNKMTVDASPCAHPRVIHYNNFFKPWNYSGVPYEDHFWHYARNSPYLGTILINRSRFSEKDRERDLLGLENLRRSVRMIIEDEGNFKNALMAKGALA